MFKRRSRDVPRLRVTAGQMQNESIGRLPQDLAEGSGTPGPAPEYIEQAVEPPEELWARERERYREKAESERRDRQEP